MFSLQSPFSNWIVNIRLSIIYLVYACRVQSVAPPLVFFLIWQIIIGLSVYYATDYSVWKWTLKWKHLVKKREFILLSKFIFNMGSLEMYDRNTKSVQVLLFPPPKSWTLLIMIIFLFCYGVLMKLCFYLKNHN
jgi:uncharacterized integral membrane protein